MKIKTSVFRSVIFSLSLVFLMANLISCQPKEKHDLEQPPPGAEGTTPDTEKTEEPKTEDSHKGIGEVKEVKLTDPLDKAMVKSGQMIYDMKCASCHKLNEERVVGPGWSGISNRRSPEWIMNMVTNVDIMLDKDPQAQALLEQCLVRMPNQNVSVTDARSILEFMRDNDVKTVKKKDEAAKK